MDGGAGADIVLGGNGEDNFAGGAGRDLLIGGNGGDTIDGRSGNDILIAGTTDHDNDDTALLAILAEWMSKNTYLQRTANLRNGSGPGGGLNDPFFLEAGVTVFDDGSTDILSGNPGQDWFFASLVDDLITDLTAKELVENL